MSAQSLRDLDKELIASSFAIGVGLIVFGLFLLAGYVLFAPDCGCGESGPAVSLDG